MTVDQFISRSCVTGLSNAWNLAETICRLQRTPPLASSVQSIIAEFHRLNLMAPRSKDVFLRLADPAELVDSFLRHHEPEDSLITADNLAVRIREWATRPDIPAWQLQRAILAAVSHVPSLRGELVYDRRMD